MKIGIDFDGVIIDFERQVRAYAALYDMEVSQNGVVDKNAFVSQIRFGFTREQSLGFRKKYLSKLTPKAAVFPLAKEMLKRLREQGHEIYVVSARSVIGGKPVKSAKKVLRKHKIKVDGWFGGTGQFDGGCPVMDKATVCSVNNLDIFIEDNPDTVESVAKAKIKCIYMRDNRSREIKNDFVFETDNWVDIYQFIQTLS
ncbi:MAG: hypothetical protein FWC00_01290 [Firmicutes bacterium]|nr:hypothetical protein [Bacillota bacterium]